jgi:hypothetical protein
MIFVSGILHRLAALPTALQTPNAANFNQGKIVDTSVATAFCNGALGCTTVTVACPHACWSVHFQLHFDFLAPTSATVRTGKKLQLACKQWTSNTAYVCPRFFNDHSGRRTQRRTLQLPATRGIRPNSGNTKLPQPQQSQAQREAPS